MTAKQESALVQGLFANTVMQLENMRGWKPERWGIYPEDIDRAAVEAETLTWPEQPLTALVLVPYAVEVRYAAENHGRPDKRYIGPARSFDDLWELVATAHTPAWRDPALSSSFARFRLRSGLTHTRGLRWEVIDLGAHAGHVFDWTRPPANLAHAGVMAAAAHFPEWLRAIGNGAAPPVRLAGYEVSLPDQESWRHVPYLAMEHGELYLTAMRPGNQSLAWAMPVTVQVP